MLSGPRSTLLPVAMMSLEEWTSGVLPLSGHETHEPQFASAQLSEDQFQKLWRELGNASIV